ncbi:hypothetical protein I6Y99_000082 [Vibrio parahaemolyticus]|uniref:hypothetical protein n=1 Tax=Vibrio parahaemolyticus TaxID=670 RepID=UPI00111E3376|nr:hypothetical protein [Vibrio parahaemolyticus]EGQ7792856.1 hypothetical protein [Vibrio parahaemolyticus]EGQ7806151.1 hypothetical protein [Vibrio parahaemolyticus]EGQ8533496.1 hypothetical protein [Vibrio parahaemolyticus]EJG1114435.1 hypothetical protein [Vibrio parahaemolyticus]MBM4979023.1 hypothetical protein [Vibrio parahaemolyticus]
MKKRNLALLILLFGSTTSLASVMDPDCDAEKAAKAAATKAVVGVGGRCTPKEALKDTAVDAGKEKKTVKDVTKKLDKD